MREIVTGGSKFRTLIWNVPDSGKATWPTHRVGSEDRSTWIGVMPPPGDTRRTRKRKVLGGTAVGSIRRFLDVPTGAKVRSSTVAGPTRGDGGEISSRTHTAALARGASTAPTARSVRSSRSTART